MKTIPPEYDGLTINGRLPATIELVKSWCKEAKAPVLADDDAVAIARDVNYALWLEGQWRDEYKADRDKNVSTQRMQRIADALLALQIDLPKAMEDTRRGNPDADLAATESLLELVGRHQAIIDAYPRRKRGRGRSLEKNLSTNLANKVQRLWGDAAPMSAVNAFAAIALTWLTGRSVPITDEAARKARERRKKKADLCPAFIDAQCSSLVFIWNTPAFHCNNRNRSMSDQDNRLVRELLLILSNIESSLQPGDSALVQPDIDGTHLANAISVPGYDWSQIDSQLRSMCQRGLISSGSVRYDAAGIGIFFSGLTASGRRLIGK